MSWRIVFLALGLAGCGTAGLPLPQCADMQAPGDNGIASTPCPNAPGYSRGCVSMPSGTPVSSCVLTDAPAGGFRTTCEETCPR